MIRFFLVAVFAALAVGLGWELLAQKGSVETSILSLAQQNGFWGKVSLEAEPSKGIWHFIGWIGSSCMILMLLYSVRKRFRLFHQMGSLYAWLNAHIVLGIIGPLLVTYHTTFKLGGLISVSFWCMALVASSGVLGRYFFMSIPRGITGNELEIHEIEIMMEKVQRHITVRLPDPALIERFTKDISASPDSQSRGLLSTLIFSIQWDLGNFRKISKLKSELNSIVSLGQREKKAVLTLIKKKAKLIRGVHFLSTNQKLLHYWHVFHIPLTLIMFLIMFLHVGIYFVFRVQ